MGAIRIEKHGDKMGCYSGQRNVDAAGEQQCQHEMKSPERIFAVELATGDTSEQIRVKCLSEAGSGQMLVPLE